MNRRPYFLLNVVSLNFFRAPSKPLTSCSSVAIETVLRHLDNFQNYKSGSEALNRRCATGQVMEKFSQITRFIRREHVIA